MIFKLMLMASLVGLTIASVYYEINGLQCIKSEFVKTRTGRSLSKIECASLCDITIDCQAFSVADGPCRLFVFNRCSKYVRDCACTRRAAVFVKQQPGLPPGALCPAGFGDDLCGTKYKFYAGIKDWFEAKAGIDREPGLTIFADVTDQAELAHMHQILVKRHLSIISIGGFQLSGSAEPAGGWVWASCISSIDSGLWNTVEPNNGGGLEHCTVVGSSFDRLNDGTASYHGYAGFLGECISPFE